MKIPSQRDRLGFVMAGVWSVGRKSSVARAESTETYRENECDGGRGSCAEANGNEFGRRRDGKWNKNENEYIYTYIKWVADRGGMNTNGRTRIQEYDEWWGETKKTNKTGKTSGNANATVQIFINLEKLFLTRTGSAAAADGNLPTRFFFSRVVRVWNPSRNRPSPLRATHPPFDRRLYIVPLTGFEETMATSSETVAYNAISAHAHAHTLRKIARTNSRGRNDRRKTDASQAVYKSITACLV